MNEDEVQPQLEDPEEQRKEKGILVLFRFVVVPLILVGFIVFLILLFGNMALKEKSVRDYLYDIRTGSQSERWQAAYHLSNLLASPTKDYRSEARKELPEMMLIFRNEKGKDPQIRRYLALAMGGLQDPRAVPALQESIQDEDSQTAFYSIWAIGNIGDKGSTPMIIETMESNDSGIRIISAYVLGALGDPRSIPPLQAHLEDSEAEVRWNSAIALSRLNNDAGADVLMDLMKREYLAGFNKLSEERKEELMVNAIKASAKLKKPELLEQIKKLSTSDPNPRVRDAAIKITQS
ncbi:HEAT repeat domain-containing protein [bacterium]|nr:HEAT repeat domain-containing protein [bacterium]MCI0614131.1 HEAT repeat domain-containing protein [bacterium]